MYNVVKLILTCQVEDDIIPQLIPLIWISSVIMVIFIFLILINIYYYKNEKILFFNDCEKIMKYYYKW